MLRYCGGCNPQFDRVALARRLGEKFPDVEFITEPDAEEVCGAAVIICGCSSTCANHNGYNGLYGKMIVWREESIDALCNFIASVRDKVK